MSSVVPLPHHFFERSALEVAPALLGRRLHGPGDVVLEITEVEAYLPHDTACHAHRGRTPRTAPMFGPAGHLYVYLCYGIHHLLNIVTEREGTPGCVLIRGARVVAGHTVVQERRGGRLDLRGPGKVGQALALDVSWSGASLADSWPAHALAVAGDAVEDGVLTGPRVGIDYASPEHRAAPWRYWIP